MSHRDKAVYSIHFTFILYVNYKVAPSTPKILSVTDQRTNLSRFVTNQLKNILFSLLVMRGKYFGLVFEDAVDALMEELVGDGGINGGERVVDHVHVRVHVDSAR